MHDISTYSAILNEEKWISKIDFIYRLKSTCDCSQGKHFRFLQLLYRLKFSQIKRGERGEIFIKD